MLMGSAERFKKEILEDYYSDINDVRLMFVQKPYRDIFNTFIRDKPYTVLQQPVIDYNGISGQFPYVENAGGYCKFNIAYRGSIHIGQRKLFMSELWALTQMLTSHTEVGLVIYAGSAPSMKLWYLMQLFPNVKFLLVDPNEFAIYDGRYDLPHYVRCDRSYVDNGDRWGVYKDKLERKRNREDYVYLSYSKSDMYESHIYKQKNLLWYNAETHGLEFKRKPTTFTKYGASKRQIGEHSGEYELLSPRVSQASIDYIFNSDHRVYFVEEYFTTSIAKMIANASERNPDIKTAFWSDIRTNMELGDAPEDADILLNNAWTYSWMRIMNPTQSMLKFRCPFFNDPDTNLGLDRYTESFDEAALYGYDWRTPTWKDGKYMFFAGRIMLQCWTGSLSKETRLIVKRDDVISNNLVAYDVKEYDDKFNFYNNIERSSVLYENPFANKEIGFDHCNDCAIEAHIWGEYKKLVPDFDVHNAIETLVRILKVNIKDRNNVYAHGHLYPDLTLTNMIEQIKKYDYDKVINRKRR